MSIRLLVFSSLFLLCVAEHTGPSRGDGVSGGAALAGAPLAQLTCGGKSDTGVPGLRAWAGCVPSAGSGAALLPAVSSFWRCPCSMAHGPPPSRSWWWCVPLTLPVFPSVSDSKDSYDEVESSWVTSLQNQPVSKCISTCSPNSPVPWRVTLRAPAMRVSSGGHCSADQCGLREAGFKNCWPDVLFCQDVVKMYHCFLHLGLRSGSCVPCYRT